MFAAGRELVAVLVQVVLEERTNIFGDVHERLVVEAVRLPELDLVVALADGGPRNVGGKLAHGSAWLDDAPRRRHTHRRTITGSTGPVLGARRASDRRTPPS